MNSSSFNLVTAYGLCGFNSSGEQSSDTIKFCVPYTLVDDKLINFAPDFKQDSATFLVARKLFFSSWC